MRPIDADKLLKCVEASMLNNTHRNGNAALCHVSEHRHFIETIVEQPTVFDAEKVIEEFENLREVELHTVDMCDELGNGDGESQYNDGVSQGRYEAFIEAIEIVERGGRDGEK
jgi:hypothetical protein